VTERCNHYCLMCSQPPKDIDDGWIIDEISDAIDLIDPRTESIGFTGGEPLLERQRSLGLLGKMRARLPQPRVTVLSHGRAFVDHIALMGLENTGLALANPELLWIDPLDYADDLAQGVGVLRGAGVHVSVYNLPLCLLDRSVWDVAVQSISDWKNAYLPVCEE